jgi:hypothetical protein
LYQVGSYCEAGPIVDTDPCPGIQHGMNAIQALVPVTVTRTVPGTGTRSTSTVLVLVLEATSKYFFKHDSTLLSVHVSTLCTVKGTLASS